MIALSIRKHFLLFLVFTLACQSESNTYSQNPKIIEIKPFKHVKIAGHNGYIFVAVPFITMNSSYLLSCDSSEMRNIRLEYIGDTLKVTELKHIENYFFNEKNENGFNPSTVSSFTISAPDIQSITSDMNFAVKNVNLEYLKIRTLTDSLSPYSSYPDGVSVQFAIESAYIKLLDYESRDKSSIHILRNNYFEKMVLKMNSDTYLVVDESSEFGKITIKSKGNLEVSLPKNALDALQK